MLTIQEIEREIAKLSPEELSRLRAWFDEFDAQIWDQQFDEDVSSGKLDQISIKAIKEFKSGEYREI